MFTDIKVSQSGERRLRSRGNLRVASITKGKSVEFPSVLFSVDALFFFILFAPCLGPEWDEIEFSYNTDQCAYHQLMQIAGIFARLRQFRMSQGV